jgi:uncharacterized Zn-binding protein involved in type VI secretion
MGKVPVPIVVEPEGAMVTAGAAVATIMDFVPMVNIATFGLCNSPANPATMNPTGTAPCVPVIVSPWAPGAPTVTVNGVPALTADSTCTCVLSGGAPITITSPGQAIVDISG